MRAVWMRIVGWAALALLAACTPEYTQQTGIDLASKSGVLDSVSIERANQRLLSSQGPVCLLSNIANTDEGGALLRTMQSAFSGYFVAVGVETTALDYTQTLSAGICPSSAYLFFVQPGEGSCLEKHTPCERNSRAQFVINIVNRADQSLLDRVVFSVRSSWLPWRSPDNPDRLQKAFEQLAQGLTGANAG